LVELVAAARSRAELEAVFAILRGRGAYERLFAKLDGTVVALLVLLGGWREPTPLRAGDLIALFTRLGLLPDLTDLNVDPGGSGDPARQLRSLAGEPTQHCATPPTAWHGGCAPPSRGSSSCSSTPWPSWPRGSRT
jgi:hypothetical protein